MTHSDLCVNLWLMSVVPCEPSFLIRFGRLAGFAGLFQALGACDLRGRVGVTNRQVGEQDPEFLGVGGTVPEDRTALRVALDPLAGVMRLGRFREQQGELK